MDQVTLGSTIKDIRARLGIDQSQLADMLGVTTSTISRWENNESVPRVKKLKQIAQIGHISVEELQYSTVDNTINQIAEKLSRMVMQTLDPVPQNLFNEVHMHVALSAAKDSDEYIFKKFAYRFLKIIYSDKYMEHVKIDSKQNGIVGINYCAAQVIQIAKKLNIQAYQTQLLYDLFVREAEAHFAEETRTNEGLFNLAMFSVEDIYATKIPKLLHGEHQNDGNSVELPNSINKKYLQELEKILKNCENEIYRLGVKYGIYKDNE